ncbi:gas vesicle protein [Thermonema lapsum]|jgi:gas vesicle protein|uniref:Gas vesicle protein n=1 Tax=Thermonema lapsum TaxID=28195 RepID=A0A846MQ92_9BACT|nr:YtxH domain-containing protein [Thermonema lapsum]NIK73625.1 gas vesicle protein [Thermonema lapsum]
MYSEQKHKSNDHFLLGLVLGAVAGATIALLYAPAEGKEVRRMLSYKLRKAKESLEQLIHRLKSGERVVSQAKIKNEQLVSETKEKAERLLGEVEALIEQIQKTK